MTSKHLPEMPIWMILGLLFALDSMASVQILDSKEQKFSPAACAERDICDLVGARLVEENYKVTLPEGVSYGTRAFAEFETTDVAKLEKYAYVNFIRGCQFDSVKMRDGKVIKQLNHARDEFFGVEGVAFHHPQWVIDSTDVDPMYNSIHEPGMSRHAAYRWNSVKGSFNQKTEAYFGNAAPARPVLYVSDRPGTAFLSDTLPKAKNISLEFKMCLYKASEIPLVAKADDLSFAEPIHCFPWRSSLVYDWQAGKFTNPAAVDPVCN